MDSTPTLDPPTNELTTPLAASSTERCANCGAHMAPDQRYCLECGERRSGGGLRDALPRSQAVVSAAAPRRPLMSANSSLIAGVATLLIALGVGVLIGSVGDGNGGGRASAPQVVTVSAGASGAAAETAAADSSGASKSSKTARKAAKKAKVSGASSVDEAAKKNGVKLPPKVVKIGQKCEKGAKGCESGKFTGNFFGGG